MILSRLFSTNISALRAWPGFRGRGASAFGTDGDACGLTGSTADGAGLGSGGGAECGAACGFDAGSATGCTGCGLCICGEDAPAPDASRGGTAASADDFAIADGAAGAFGSTFAVVIAFATGFAEGWAFATGA